MKTSQQGPNITITAGEALTKHRFVDFEGKHTVDLPSIGVTSFDVDSGDQASLDAGSVVVVEAGGAISAGALVKSDANGKAVTATTTFDIKVCGIAMSAATATGDFIDVKRLW